MLNPITHSIASWPANKHPILYLCLTHRILFFSFFFSRYEQLITICGHHHHHVCHPCSTLDMDITFLIHNTSIMVSPLDCLNYLKPNFGLSRVVLDMYISRGLIVIILTALWLYIWKSPLSNGWSVLLSLCLSTLWNQFIYSILRIHKWATHCN
jgi:hypothetical protein